MTSKLLATSSVKNRKREKEQEHVHMQIQRENERKRNVKPKTKPVKPTPKIEVCYFASSSYILHFYSILYYLAKLTDPFIRHSPLVLGVSQLSIQKTYTEFYTTEL